MGSPYDRWVLAIFAQYSLSTRHTPNTVSVPSVLDCPMTHVSTTPIYDGNHSHLEPVLTHYTARLRDLSSMANPSGSPS
jgi:hypothetical protein